MLRKLPGVRVVRAKAKTTSVHIPWGRLNTTPVEVCLSDVLLELEVGAVGGGQGVAEGAEGGQPDEGSSSEGSTAGGVQLVTEQFGESSGDEPEDAAQQAAQQRKPPAKKKGWFLSMLARAFRNATVRYERMTVRLRRTDGGGGAVLCLDEFTAFSVDEAGQPAVDGSDDIVRKDHLLRGATLRLVAPGGGAAAEVLSVPSGNVLVMVPLEDGLPRGDCDVKCEASFPEIGLAFEGRQPVDLRELIGIMGEAIATLQNGVSSRAWPGRRAADAEGEAEAAERNGNDGAGRQQQVAQGEQGRDHAQQQQQQQQQQQGQRAGASSLLRRTWSFVTNESASQAAGLGLSDALESELDQVDVSRASFRLAELSVSVELLDVRVGHGDGHERRRTHAKVYGVVGFWSPDSELAIDLVDLSVETRHRDLRGAEVTHGLFLQTADRARITVSPPNPSPKPAAEEEDEVTVADGTANMEISLRGLDAFAWNPRARARLPLLHRAAVDVLVRFARTLEVAFASDALALRASLLHLPAYQHVIWDLVCAYRALRGPPPPTAVHSDPAAPYMVITLNTEALSLLLCRSAEAQVAGVAFAADASGAALSVGFFEYGQTLSLEAAQWKAEHSDAAGMAAPLALPCSAHFIMRRHQGKPLEFRLEFESAVEAHMSPAAIADVAALLQGGYTGAPCRNPNADEAPHDLVIVNAAGRALEVAPWRPALPAASPRGKVDVAADTNGGTKAAETAEVALLVPAGSMVGLSSAETASCVRQHVDGDGCLLAELRTLRRAALVVRDALGAGEAAAAEPETQNSNAAWSEAISLQDGASTAVSLPGGKVLHAEVLQAASGTRVVTLEPAAEDRASRDDAPTPNTSYYGLTFTVAVPALTMVLVDESECKTYPNPNDQADARPREMLTAALGGLDVTYATRREACGSLAAMEDATLEVSIASAQVESGVCDGAWPCILTSDPPPLGGLNPKPEPCVAAVVGLRRLVWREAAMLGLTGEEAARPELERRAWVRGAHLRMGGFTAHVDDEAVKLFGELAAMLPQAGAQAAPAAAADDETAPVAALYVRELCVSALRLRLNLRVSTSAAPVDASGASVSLSEVRMRHLLEPLGSVARTIGAHYFTEAILAAPSLLGSLNVLLNPLGLVYSVGGGVADLVGLPLQRLLRLDPLGAAQGAAQGSVSLVRRTSQWGIGSVGGFANAVARIIDHTLADTPKSEAAGLQANEVDRPDRVSAESFGTGLAAGIEHLGDSVVRALSGVVRDGNLARGLAGVVLRPVSGALGAVALGAQGVAGSLGIASGGGAGGRAERVARAAPRRASRWRIATAD